jgi:uncharacterized oxidoreductase
MKLSGNTILITGGTSGIGLGFAEAFLSTDNHVIICGRRKERLQQIKEEHPNIIIRVADLSMDDDRKELFEWTIKNYPDVNVLINNAGIQLKTDLTQSVDMDRVRSETDINFYAPIHLTSLFTEHLSSRSDAAIINISSGLAFTPLATMPIYCATKAALHSFTLSLRHQLRDSIVKVFEIIPPSVDTELGHDFRADPNKTHGGMPVNEFIKETMEVLRYDKFESAIGQSMNLYMKREELFEVLNR